MQDQNPETEDMKAPSPGECENCTEAQDFNEEEDVFSQIKMSISEALDLAEKKRKERAKAARAESAQQLRKIAQDLDDGKDLILSVICTDEDPEENRLAAIMMIPDPVSHNKLCVVASHLAVHQANAIKRVSIVTQD